LKRLDTTTLLPFELMTDEDDAWCEKKAGAPPPVDPDSSLSKLSASPYAKTALAVKSRILNMRIFIPFVSFWNSTTETKQNKYKNEKRFVHGMSKKSLR
jgi:hypothetical protein